MQGKFMIEKLNRLKDHYFLSQPHQAFFMLAFSNALLSMVLFLLLMEGTISAIIPSKLYHAYSLIYLLFTPAIFAFLFTTFPRFSATEPILKKDYLRVFSFFLLGSLFLVLGLFISIPLFYTGIFLTFMGHAFALKELYAIYKKSTVADKEDQFWILTATSFGLFSHLLFLLSLWIPSLYVFSVQISIYLYLFLLFFTVAQRMVPFFSHTPITKHKERFKVIVGLLGLHVFLELLQANASFLVDFVLAYLFMRELARWKLPFPNENPLVWILHIALFWIPLAFVLAGLTSLLALFYDLNFLYLAIHALALGFFLTMLIGFGTRVTLGHSGNVMFADSYTKYLFYWTQVVVLLRIMTSFANDFLLLLELSIFAWLLLFLAWGVRFFAVLIFGKKLKP